MNAIAMRRWIMGAMGLALLVACGGESEGGDANECPLDCIAAPSPVCDGNVVVSSTAPGVCQDDGTCLFAETRDDCGDATCVDGACEEGVTPDPCEGVVCDGPPIDTCEGPIAVTYASPGTCDEGACSYEETRTDCGADGFICEDGACVDVGDLCEGVTCPPIFECEGDVAVEEGGTCINGACSYSTVSRRDCADEGGTCSSGRCEFADPCEGVVCQDPPASTCDGNQVVSFGFAGTCIDGDCSYDETRTTCADGTVCIDGACAERPVCFGVVCNSPPADACLGDVAFRYGAGACELVEDEEGETSEQCVYEETATNCASSGQECVDGACIEPDPCTGVSCDVPDPAFCEGEVAVSYTAPGTCVAGLCAFDEVRENCTDGGGFCEDGECVVEDPCEGRVCNAPPANTCEGNVATAYALPGTCVAGDCNYVITSTDCSLRDEVCVDGECEFVDLCADEPCAPPAPSCLGPLAVSASGPGTCFIEEGGTFCDYSEVQTVENCADAGELCLDGACVGPGATLSAGALVITELFLAADAQWLEVLNPGEAELDLGGLELRNNGGDAYAVPAGTTIAPGERLVIASDDGTAATIGADLAWGGIGTLAFAAGAGDRVTLFGAEVVASVGVDASWIVGRRALGVDPLLASTGTEDRASWCPGVDRITDDFIGSPNETNPGCSARVAAGGLVINEIFATGAVLPNGSTEVWVELANVSGAAINLAGVELWTGATVHRFAPIEVPADALFVFANGPRVAARNVDASSPNLQLASDADSVTLQQNWFDEDASTEQSVVVDQVSYDGAWPLSEGASLSRASVGGDADDPADWCASTTSYPSAVASFGTPKAPNDCP